MSREDYVAIAARLVAIYVAFRAILLVPAAVQTLSHAQGADFSLLYVLVLFAIWVLCAFLWFFPLTIARKLLPVMKEQRSDQAINGSLGLSLGLTLIGAWFFAKGVTDFAYWIGFFAWTRHVSPQVPIEWAPEQVASMVATAFRLAVGFWLIFGSAGLRRLIYRFRYGTS